jgi:DNA replicative helicase MCM subunit Mcm2 (Cdc46/Mcm family)
MILFDLNMHKPVCTVIHGKFIRGITMNNINLNSIILTRYNVIFTLKVDCGD